MAETQKGDAPADPKTEQGGYRIVKQTKSRWWEVLDPAGELVCLTVYRRGARVVVRRLSPCGGIGRRGRSVRGSV